MFCGTDIIEVSRIKKAIETTKEFKNKVFTQNEINDIDSIKSEMKYQRYAGRFAAKEAIFKAMSKLLTKENITMDFLDVEIENMESLKRRPRVNFLKEDIIKLVEKENIDIDISISHINENAMAVAIVDTRRE